MVQPSYDEAGRQIAGEYDGLEALPTVLQKQESYLADRPAVVGRHGASPEPAGTAGPNA